MTECSSRARGRASRRWEPILRFGPPLVSLTALVWAGQALGQTTVSTETTTRLVTSRAGDVTVSSGGTIKPASGVAVTVDSNNNVTNSGIISFHNVDDSTSILVQGGHTSTISNGGS